MAKKPVKYYVVDAFTDSAFKGNPAAVCLLEEEREEDWLQAVAAEFNISETCYLTRITESDSLDADNENFPPKFTLRWFTPVVEVELCGHATMAAAHALFTSSGVVKSNIIEFATLSGILTAKKIPEVRSPADIQNGLQESFVIELNFPLVPLVEFNSADVSSISKALNGASMIDIKMTSTGDTFVVLPSGKDVIDMQPNIVDIQKCPGRGVIITGVAPPESGFDFYSRFFCPKCGINEDPVCGSAHCALAGYWCKKLGKADFVAYAASPRSGIVKIHLDEQKQRVLLRGKAVTVVEGTILV